jgi:hypothetical protein
VGRSRWTDEEILNSLRTVGAEVDEPLLSKAYAERRGAGTAAPTTIIGRYGSWVAALTAAGLPLPEYAHRRRWTAEEALDAVRAWLSRTQSGTWAEFEQERQAGADLPSPHVITWHFAGWKGAVAAAREVS